MTNEELAVRIKTGETELMEDLWEQVKRYAYKSANRFYFLHYDRCAEIGVELDDLEQEAYIGIYKAVEKYKPEKGVKFLTYAEYRLKGAFITAAHLHNGKDRYHETKFDDITLYAGDTDDAITLADTLTDPQAEDDMQEFAEHESRNEYLSGLRASFQNAFDGLEDNQREAVIACMVTGLSGREFAKQNGVCYQTVYNALNKALSALRANTRLAAYAAA